MSNSSWLRRAGWAAGLLLLSTGCGSPEKPEVAPVRGTVSFRGKPLSTGTIVFAPDPLRNGPGPLARADIQADGSYQLMSDKVAGATLGWHRVTVVAVIDGASAPGQRFTQPRSLLPEKYRDPELSGLSCEVKPGRPNVFNFNLE
jgi:hypothetical protein